MKNKLLHLFGLLLVAFAANAQTWTAPTLEYPFEGDEPVAEESYVFFNTKAGLFLTGAGYWGTQTALVTEKEGTVYPSVFQLAYSEDEEGWSFFLTSNVIHRDNSIQVNKFMFRAADNTAFLDMGSQGNNFWALRPQGNNVYRIQTNELNGVYGRDALDAIEERDYDKEFLGWAGSTSDMIVYTNIDPEAEGVGVDWLIIQDGKYTKEQINEFLNVTRALFSARLDLYSRAKTIVEEDLDVNYEAYTEVYNNGSIEDINAAIAELDDKIQVARVYAVLKYGEDGTNPPSETNPCDATSLIKNAAFDEGEQWQLPPYWTVDPMGQNNCWNGDTYTNDAEGITVKGFMESWIGAPTTLKDGGMYQVMKALPLGKYELGVDAKATLQSAALPFQVEGVELFATGGDITTTAPINTPDNLPLHFTMSFVSTGGDVTLGLRTRNANVNWMLADNFTLTYYGEVDPWETALDNLIKKCNETYPKEDIENVVAYWEVVNAYWETLTNASSSAYRQESGLTLQEIYNNLNEAFEALTQSVKDYQTLDAIYNKWDEKVGNLEGKWANVANDPTFSKILEEIGEGLDNHTYTSEQIATADSRLAEAFAAFIGANVAQNDDLSFLLNNPGFDDKDANGNYIKFSGWDSEWVTPAWGGEDVTYTDAAGEEKLAEGGNAEVYHAKFDIHQTIKHMPAGVFALSCKAFERDDNGQGVDAELYAIINGDSTAIQTVKVKNLLDEGSEVQLYDGTGGTNGKNADSMNGDKYVPNGMSGANVYFNEGFYENYFNIILEEPADSIIVGIRDLTGGNTWNSSGNWVLFDDFQIVFNGDGGDAWHPEIKRRIAEAETYTAEGAEYILTIEAKDSLAKAIKNGQDEIKKGKNSVKEDAKAAIEKLKEAIELAKETAALTATLNHYIEVMDMRMGDDLITTSDTSIEDVIFEIGEHLENSDFKDKAAVEQAMIDLNKAFTNYVMCDWAGATEEEPADVTPVIYNYDGNEYSYSTTVYGWDQIEGTVGYGNSEGEVAEFFDTSFEISQTIYGLLPGWYRLGVQGYYRGGVGSVVKEQYEAGQDIARHAVLFASDEAETPLLGITNMEDMTAFTLVAEENGTVALVAGEETYRIPDTAAQGSIALQNFREDETPLYQNYLLFEVKNEQKSVTIGLRKTEEVEKDWCVWDNWSLLYYGKEQPDVDPTTAIQNVTTAIATPVAIYNMAGQRVKKALKGIYIINGRKVVVK